MHYMEDLKDLLCAELQEYAENGKRSGKMSKADIEVIDTVLNSVKNIYKIDKYEMEAEGGYSEDGHYMGEGRIYGTSYDDGGMSYERGTSYARRGRGRNAKRDSMGRYSSRGMSYDDDMSYARGGRMGNRGGMRGGYSREDGKNYMMGELERLIDKATTHTEREALEKCMQALERA